MRNLDDILEEYRFLDADERYRLLIELGRELDEMPQALKTDATLVRGCSASVWVYPTEQDGKLHFLGDSNAAIAQARNTSERTVANQLAALLRKTASKSRFDLIRRFAGNRG